MAELDQPGEIADLHARFAQPGEGDAYLSSEALDIRTTRHTVDQGLLENSKTLCSVHCSAQALAQRYGSASPERLELDVLAHEIPRGYAEDAGRPSRLEVDADDRRVRPCLHDERSLVRARGDGSTKSHALCTGARGPFDSEFVFVQ